LLATQEQAEDSHGSQAKLFRHGSASGFIHQDGIRLNLQGKRQRLGFSGVKAFKELLDLCLVEWGLDAEERELAQVHDRQTCRRGAQFCFHSRRDEDVAE
jgi:hypothetical protein